MSDGVVSVTLGKNVADFLSGEVLTLTPTTTAGDNILWGCSFSGSDRYLPQSCR